MRLERYYSGGVWNDFEQETVHAVLQNRLLLRQLA